MLQHLERTDRAAKLFADAKIVQRHRECALGRAQQISAVRQCQHLEHRRKVSRDRGADRFVQGERARLSAILRPLQVELDAVRVAIDQDRTIFGADDERVRCGCRCNQNFRARDLAVLHSGLRLGVETRGGFPPGRDHDPGAVQDALARASFEQRHHRGDGGYGFGDEGSPQLFADRRQLAHPETEPAPVFFEQQGQPPQIHDLLPYRAIDPARVPTERADAIQIAPDRRNRADAVPDHADAFAAVRFGH